MKLDSLHINGFGKFHDWNCTFGPGVTIISGNNEAGKTTLAAYIRFLLFGFPKNSKDRNRYPPLDGGSHGGSAEFSLDNGSSVTIERINGGDRGVRVVSSDHGLGGEEKIQELLGGIDNDLFRKIFSINQDEIQGSDLFSDEHVRSMLHGAEMGMPPGVIEKIRDDLTTAMDAIYKPMGRKKQINEQLGLIKKIESEIKDFERRSDEYDRLNTKMQFLNKQADENEKKKSELNEELRFISRILGLKNDYMRYLELVRELETFPAMDRYSVDDFTQYQNLSPRREEIQKRIQELQKNIADSNPLDLPENWEQYVKEKELIRELWREKSLYEEKKSAIGDLEGEIRIKRSELEAIPDDIREFAETSGILASGTLPTEADIHNHSDPMETTEKGVSSLTSQTIEIKKDIQSLERSYDETKTTHLKYEEIERSKKKKAISSNTSLVAAILILIGIFLPILGFIASQLFITLGLSIVGLICIIGGILLFIRSRSSPVDNTQPGDELKPLEELLISKKDQIADRKSHLAQITQESEQALLSHQTNVLAWRHWLQSVHIPRHYTPKQASDLVFQIGELQKITHDIQVIEETIRESNTVASSYEGRVANLAHTLNLAACSEQSANLIESIYQSLQSVENQAGTKAIQSQLSVDIQKEEDSLRDISNEINEIITSSGCASDEEFRSISTQYTKKEQLEYEIEIVKTRFSEIGNKGTSNEGIAILASVDFEDLARGKERIGRSMKEIDIPIREQREAIGKIRGDIERIEGDTSGEDLRLKREITVNTLQHLTEQWAIYRAALSLLEETVKKYENERQPGVVRESERIFSEITGGRYQSVSIPASRPDIYVKDAKGEQKEIAELSRGTAEQLYLSLRFGYIREFQKSAERMPIILDEILVNFDPRRTQEACKAIAAMALSNQIVYLTCHPETASILLETIPDAHIIDLNLEELGVQVSNVLEGEPEGPTSFLDNTQEMVRIHRQYDQLDSQQSVERDSKIPNSSRVKKFIGRDESVYYEKYEGYDLTAMFEPESETSWLNNGFCDENIDDVNDNDTEI